MKGTFLAKCSLLGTKIKIVPSKEQNHRLFRQRNKTVKCSVIGTKIIANIDIFLFPCKSSDFHIKSKIKK